MTKCLQVQLQEKLTKDNIRDIKNWSEQVFARACIRKPNLEVEVQIPIGNSIIDFRVTNLEADKSRLVEVTAAQELSGVQKKRKKRQQEAMDQSGGGVILMGENMVKIRRHIIDSGGDIYGI